VMWFHFSDAGDWPPESPMGNHLYGRAGVQAFFVISGFVVPWSMEHAGYQMARLPQYLARRLLRLYPPFLATLALEIAVGYASSLVPAFRGPPFQTSPRAVMLHASMLSDWFDEPWLSTVSWSLALEVQFYVLLALAFGSITSPHAGRRRLALAALIVAAPLSDPRSALAYFGWFGLGIATFLYKRRKTSTVEYGTFAVLAIGSMWLTGDAAELIAGVVAALAIILLRTEVPVLGAIGRWSYSLYLLHTIIGNRFIHLCLRLEPASLAVQALIVVLAGLLSMAGAYVMYVWVEAPAHRAARRIPASPSP
jgi:peptidoglycan/LPS O-acetylase OafA/YrhL